MLFMTPYFIFILEHNNRSRTLVQQLRVEKKVMKTRLILIIYVYVFNLIFSKKKVENVF